MSLRGIEARGAVGSLRDGLSRQFDRMEVAARKIASGQGDVVANTTELKQAEVAARATMAALAQQIEHEREAIDLLA